MPSLKNSLMLPQAITLARVKLYQYCQQILPLSCLLCQQGVKAGLVCPTCYQDLKQTYPHCERCGLPLASQQSQCGQCISRPPIFTQLTACGLFDAPLYQLIYKLKYQQQAIYSQVLGRLLAEQIRARDDMNPAHPPQALIPVPLHPRKEQQRGFNQAQLIANHSAKQLNIPCQARWLTRVKDTASQTQLNLKQRQKNMQQAFAINHLPAGIKHVAIVDDIVTTGATVHSLCKALRHAGVDQIEIWCICRTPPNRG